MSASALYAFTKAAAVAKTIPCTAPPRKTGAAGGCKCRPHGTSVWKQVRDAGVGSAAWRAPAATGATGHGPVQFAATPRQASRAGRKRAAVGSLRQHARTTHHTGVRLNQASALHTGRPQREAFCNDLVVQCAAARAPVVVAAIAPVCVLCVHHGASQSVSRRPQIVAQPRTAARRRPTRQQIVKRSWEKKVNFLGQKTHILNLF
jgi:hypothetical protein